MKTKKKTTSSTKSTLRGCHHDHGTPSLETIMSQLKQEGFRITRPRQVLLEVMLQYHTPFSAEDLFKRLEKASQNTKIDLVTVYRSLNTFVGTGLLSRIDLDDGVARYELKSSDGSHHHHITCTACRRVEPVTVCEVSGQEAILSKMGYSQLSHRLEFFGLCPSCRPR